MNNNKFCSCQYKNPIELICIDRKCKKRLFCKGCAYDDPNKKNIKLFQEWEALITKDCDLQDLYDILDQVMEITKKQLCAAVEKRCLLIKATLSMQINPLKRIAEAINNVSKKQYNADTMEYLVQELDCNNFAECLNQMEATSYQQNKLVCEEIINMTNKLEQVINLGKQDQKVGELGKIRKSIQQKLDFKFKEENKYYFPDCKPTQNQKKISITEISNASLNLNEQQNIQPNQQLQQPKQQKKKCCCNNLEKQNEEQPNIIEEKRNRIKTVTDFDDIFINTERRLSGLQYLNCLYNYPNKNQPLSTRNVQSKTPYQPLKK